MESEVVPGGTRKGRPRAERPPAAEEVRRLALECGADDAACVSLDLPALAEERSFARRALPGALSAVALVLRMNRSNIRTPERATANLEFHQVGDEVNAVARRLVAALERRGVRALNPPMGFPMQMERFPGRIWTVSHKTIAVAAGLGRMGVHRNLIHPRFGNFILLGTVLTDLGMGAEAVPMDWNPCVECKLCVAACPVGAIADDGAFEFQACYTHNYREFMGGFTHWVEGIAESRDARSYRRRTSDADSASMWQSLSFGANYKAAYCLAVCPAGEDVIAPYARDRKRFLDDVLRPLREKEEDVYVIPESDAEEHVRRRFPAKRVKRVSSGLRPRTVDHFLNGLPHVFQRGRAGDLDAVYEFTFTGAEERVATVVISEGRVEVREGPPPRADLAVRADRDTWMECLAGERSLLLALLRRRIRIRGPLRLMRAFARCFPS